LALEEFDDRAGAVSQELLNQPSVIFNQHRLVILLDLSYSGAVDFTQLKYDLRTNDGALATNLKALLGEGLIQASKEKVGSREKTGYLITPKGMDAVKNLLKVFKDIGGIIPLD
jgi:DNA-binding HxlR family transcriptional regulator